ncbi:MAG: pyridoxamine 5'-phosphate oxidase family protein [Dehalococcoidia bacterium]
MGEHHSRVGACDTVGAMSDKQQLTAEQVTYVNTHRVSRLATADGNGVPHLVPLCHVATETTIYLSNGFERNGRKAKRVRNLLENPYAAFLVDHYTEDWDKLSYVLAQGRVELLEDGAELVEAVRLLKQQYHQWRDWTLEEFGVAALRIERVVVK